MRSSMTKLRSTKKFEIVLDSNKLKWFYMSCAAALPQLDRGSDYESERHRFESYTPHQLKLKASGNGGFSFMATPHGFEPRSRRGRKADDFLSTRVRFRVDVATYSRPLLLKRPIRVIFRGRASDIQAQVSRSQEALSGDARAACGTLIWRGLETLWRGSA